MLTSKSAWGLIKMNALNQGIKDEPVKLDVMGEDEEKIEEKKIEFKMETKKNKPGMIGRPIFWQVISVILFIILVFMFFSANRASESVSESEAQAIVKDYVDTVLQGQELVAEVGEALLENGLYRVEVVINNQPISSYLSLDGKLFFPNAVDLERFELLRDSFNAGEIDADASDEAIENLGEDISEESAGTNEEVTDDSIPDQEEITES